jgi:cytochrome c oxidase cbb3-type subunit 3
MGPALMDAKWLYGSDPAQIFTTIMDGRPNGMPAFRGRIPEEQAWQLVAYVRSMSGLTPKDGRPSRSDGMQAIEAESRRSRQDPMPQERGK